MAKVLIVGGGGREHALGWKIGQSPHVNEVIYAPGNGGTQEGKGRNVSAATGDFDGIEKIIRTEKIDLTVVGPEEPLANGLVDYLADIGHTRVFGPTKAGAQIEADKFFSYDVMESLSIPQARSTKCKGIEQARKAIIERSDDRGVVIKSRGLAAGKGVRVCDDAIAALDAIEGHLQRYGDDVLIAERLSGEEFSLFGFCDGVNANPLEIAFQDHKRLLDSDMGPNTGGMGAYGPVKNQSPARVRSLSNLIMTPVVKELARRTHKPYVGFLYAGMIQKRMEPKIIEFNCRFGDPECQPAMMLIKSDMYELINNALDRKPLHIKYNPGAAVCVVMASRGYPDTKKDGLLIEGLGSAIGPGVKIFHSGTKLADNRTVTNGGRVLGVTAYSPDGIKKARELAYSAAALIKVEGGLHYRTDIAEKEMRD